MTRIHSLQFVELLTTPKWMKCSLWNCGKLVAELNKRIKMRQMAENKHIKFKHNLNIVAVVCCCFFLFTNCEGVLIYSRKKIVFILSVIWLLRLLLVFEIICCLYRIHRIFYGYFFLLFESIMWNKYFEKCYNLVFI